MASRELIWQKDLFPSDITGNLGVYLKEFLKKLEHWQQVSLSEGKPTPVAMKLDGDDHVMSWLLNPSKSIMTGNFSKGWKEFQKAYNVKAHEYICFYKEPHTSTLTIGYHPGQSKALDLKNQNSQQILQNPTTILQKQPKVSFPQHPVTLFDLNEVPPEEDEEEETEQILLEPEHKKSKLRSEEDHINVSAASHIVGYPRIGPKRELKFALQLFWSGNCSVTYLKKVGKHLRTSMWKQMAEAGLKFIPSNTFSYYDQVLDTTAMLGAVPPRFGFKGGEIGFDVYFSMARGYGTVPAMYMSRWFDTKYHYAVPELSYDLSFSYASHKAVEEYKEAKELGIDTVPVLVGPISYLMLSKPAKGVAETLDFLTLLVKILPIYKAVIFDLVEAGATWIQLDEPSLVMDLQPQHLEVFVKAYNYLDVTSSGAKLLVETYFADIPVDTYNVITKVKGISGFGFDLVRGTRTIDLIQKVGFPSDKLLFAGVVDGRNVWANDMMASSQILEYLQNIVGKEKLIVSTSCSLIHTPVDLRNETTLDAEIKSWFSFAAQKLNEVVALAKALEGHKDEALFAANARAQASRKSSPRVTNEAVQKDIHNSQCYNQHRATPVNIRLENQKLKWQLPRYPTTTVGFFPYSNEVKNIHQLYERNQISKEAFDMSMKKEIKKIVKMQEEIGIDVLVHGEPERGRSVEYLARRLQGFACTNRGWIQHYGAYCLRPPIIYGDVTRPVPMTLDYTLYAQSLTSRPVKGMLTGPVTILNCSFERVDIPRSETCLQIALAIKSEVKDLEDAGIHVIQIIEPLLHRNLPLQTSEYADYMNWALHSFRITNSHCEDATQIHTHIHYNELIDMHASVLSMDADVFSLDCSTSNEKLLSTFKDRTVGIGVDPALNIEEFIARISKILSTVKDENLWIIPWKNFTFESNATLLISLASVVAASRVMQVSEWFK